MSYKKHYNYINRRSSKKNNFQIKTNKNIKKELDNKDHQINL